MVWVGSDRAPSVRIACARIPARRHRRADRARVSLGGLDVLPIAPALWVMIVGLAAVLGTRSARFAPRTWATTLGLVLLSQLVMHVGMAEAPWVFGLRVHHQAALVSPSMLVAHLVATAVLVVVVWRLDRLLGALSRVVRVLTAPLPVRPRGACVVARVAVPVDPWVPLVGIHRAVPMRGPPLSA